MILRISREDHYFDLGMEVGNVDGYCRAIIDFVIEAITYERQSLTYEYPGTTALNYMLADGATTAHFAFVVGAKFDHERILQDLIVVYSHLASAMDEHYPDWTVTCPGRFTFRLTPGYFEFAMGHEWQ